MKWYDVYFLSFLILGIAMTSTISFIFYKTYPVSAGVSALMGVTLTIGVLIDWKSFRRRHNL